jgi:hypothetical protein
MVYPAFLPLMRTPRLPVVDYTNAPADLNGLARFVGRRKMVCHHISTGLYSTHSHINNTQNNTIIFTVKVAQ